MRNLLSISYTFLFLLLPASIGGYVCGVKQGVEWIKDVSLNTGTGVFGILLTVFLIDEVIRRNEARERKRVREVAFQQLRIPLLHQLTMLHSMYKASIPSLPENQPVEIRDLFSDSYFIQLAFLDFSKPAPLASAMSLQWFDYLKMEVEKFKLALGRTIEKYAIFLDGGTVELLETLINSTFISLLETFPAIRELDRKEGFSRTYNLCAGTSMAEIVRGYTNEFTRLVELYNATVPAEQKLTVGCGFWRKDIAPQFGSARLRDIEKSTVST